MRDNQTLDAMLGTLGAQDSFEVPDDFMTGVWQRAGQLGEIVERRRRMALFAGLFVVGLGAGAGTSGWPAQFAGSQASIADSIIVGERLSPSALLHVER
ncbi:hypothetical protein [Novosphingopyxis baekryungensis]|jgi:hypothetical protein|uniref:hypothetical protein n=1 Tax=Novosphingopyxis baekryungensis TaxID=279369 RepID=UPI0003B5E858|nr:hypothetical protein [Novosphingopyxis baekryungensis]